MVALGLTTVLMIAILPQLMAGLRSTGTANAVTHAKGVAQSELEQMRNLPYHVAPSAGGYVDVLDRYYPNLVQPTSAPACADPIGTAPTAWSGYVPPSSTARCAFEPATGAFYRTVRSVSSDRGPLALVVATQFLSGATPPVAVTPKAGYDTLVNGRDLPASSQLGVTATVVYADHRTTRPMTTYTQVAAQPGAPTRILADTRATALQVGSVTADDVALSLVAGLVNAAGSVSTVSTVTGNATSVSAGLATGEQARGASSTVQAPPTSSIPALSSPAGALPVHGCAYACWSASQLGAASVSAQDGLPRAGSSASPIQAGVSDTASNSGVTFGTGALDSYRPALRLTGPLVRLDGTEAPYPAQLIGCTVSASGTVTASGYLHSTDSSSGTAGVEACSAARTTPVSLFPTDFAPRGVVRVRLDHASVRCAASPSTGTATHDYRAVVEVWTGTEFVTVAEVLAGQTTDPLAAVPMTTPVGGGMTLGDYVASWTAATAGTVRTRQQARTSEVSVPGVVTIASQPVRPDDTAPDGLDAASAVALTFGAVSCSTEDAR